MGCGSSSPAPQNTRSTNNTDYTKPAGNGTQNRTDSNQNKSRDSGFNDSNQEVKKSDGGTKQQGGMGTAVSYADDDGISDNNFMHHGGMMVSFGGGGGGSTIQETREPTPPPKDPTPPPPKDPTPPPPKDPTPPPPKDPTPPPPKEPTPPPPKKTPTPPPPKGAPSSASRECADSDANGEYERVTIHDDVALFYHRGYKFAELEIERDQLYAQVPTELPFVDIDFGPEVAIKGESVEWKRPGVSY